MGIHSEQGVQTIINYKNDSVILAKTNEDGLKMWFTLTLYKLHKGKVKVKFYMRKKNKHIEGTYKMQQDFKSRTS